MPVLQRLHRLSMVRGSSALHHCKSVAHGRRSSTRLGQQYVEMGNGASDRTGIALGLDARSHHLELEGAPVARRQQLVDDAPQRNVPVAGNRSVRRAEAADVQIADLHVREQAALIREAVDNDPAFLGANDPAFTQADQGPTGTP